MRHRWKISTVVMAALMVGAIAPQLPASAAAAFESSEPKAYIVDTKHGKLYLEVVHPMKNDKIVKAPVVLTYTPYSALGRNGDASTWNQMGIARAYADLIGTGNSGGCYDYGGKRERESGKALVEYIAKAKWSTGKVAMMGGSYDGTTATSTATTKPKGLVTIVPIGGISRWYGYAYSGGMRYTYNNEVLGHEGVSAADDQGFDTPLAFDFGLAVPPPLDPQNADWADRVQTSVTPCDELSHVEHGYDDTPDYDKFWEERDYLDGAKKIKIPVLVAHNWGDWNVKQEEGWNLFNALRGKNKKMYFGSRYDDHGRPGGKFDQVLQKWMAHYLLGEDNGIQKLPRFTSQTADYSGAGKWTAANKVKTKNMKLIAQAILTTDPKEDVWQLLPHPPDMSKYQGQTPPTASWPVAVPNAESHANLHPRMNHEWQWFQSPPLKKDLRIFGSPKVKVWSTIGREWITLTPVIVDFNHADHKTVPVVNEHYTENPKSVVAATRGFLDSRYRDGLKKQKLFKPGKSVGMTIVTKPQDYTFKKGHSIGINFMSENVEWVASKPYTGEGAENTDITLDWTKGQTQVHLPVVGGGNFENYFGEHKM